MGKQSKRKEELPAEVYVYVCDYDDGEPIYAATTDINGIDNGARVGCYGIMATLTMQVTKELV